MFVKNSIGGLERHAIYLSKPSGELLGCLDEFINEQTANLVRGLNQQLQLSFEINRLDNGWYEYIQEGMYLVVEDVGIFKMKQPRISNDGTIEIKDVTAFSCDIELEDKNIDLEINMGTKTSQEYLVTYADEDADEEVINPYTGIPYDWLVLYNTFPEQLRAHLYDFDHGVYGNTSDEIVVYEKAKIDKLNELFTLIPRLKNKFIKTVDSDTGSTDYELVEYADITYNTYNDSIQSITLYTNYRSRIVYLIDFYTRNRDQLSLLTCVLEKTFGAWKVGDVFGVSDGNYSLANKKYQFEISENIYSFLTTTLAQTTNCMVTFDVFNRQVNLTPVENIGKDTGIVLSYDNLLNNLGIESQEDNLSTRLIVTGEDDLSIEQVNFGLDYIDDLSYKMNAVDENGKRIYVSDALATKYKNYITTRESLREEYIQLSKDYRTYSEQIDEIRNRVPLDDLKTDWGTFSQDELSAALTAYKNLLASLISLYRSEYYPYGLNDDDSVNEDFIKNTVYWYDYDAYQNVITEIECAISTFPYYSDHDKWSDYNKTRYEDAIKEWETEWTLYGTEELQAKISAYKNNMDVLAESSVIKVSSDSDVIKSWNQLSDAEKTEFGNISDNYKYDEYMSYYDNMVDAKEYLDELQEQINDIEDLRTASQTRRTEIVGLVSLENNFTSRECKELSLLIREADCSNENILITNIDTAEQKIDKMVELLEYGQEQLSIMCRPQLTFTISSDNLLALTDFESFWEDFEVGNFLLVQYRDDTYMKLRMIGYEYNPCLPASNQFTITFSNMVRSKVGVTDLESILGLSATNTNRSSGGSGRSGSGGAYGESDDIDITISNTMLSKLLNSELFGTRVSDIILNTIDVNAITARYAKFDGLANGVTIIDGQCITTGWIKSLDWNGTTDGGIDNTSGSILNLNDGKFNFGGGKVKYNGTTLTVDGNIVATTLSTGGRTSANTGHDGAFIDSQGNFYSGSTNAVIIYKDGKFNFGNGGITYDGVATTISSSTGLGNSTVGQALSDIVTAQSTADSKAKIFYGSPTGTYTGQSEGDYLVDTTTGATATYRWSDADQDWIVAADYADAIEDAVEDVIDELLPQIDGKVETWTQQTDPKQFWDAADYQKHDGDLWLYTGVTAITVNTVTISPSKTYRYNNTTGKWELYQTPNKTLFDYADGKSTIYYGTTSSITPQTTPDLEEGDYLVDSTDGCTYKRDNNAWVKVTDYSNAISTAVTALRNDLEAQIDAKIETWAQDSNPATAWTTADLKSGHNGDLWYYIGITGMTVDNVAIEPSKTYQYQYNSSTQTGLWVEYHSPNKSLFDLADGKSTVFYDDYPFTDITTMQDRDLAVDSDSQRIYRYDDTLSTWVEVTNYKDYVDTEIAGLAEDLEEQIDAKIETWAKNSDPAASWSADDYASHVGDLWLFTGMSEILVSGVTIHPQGIYKFKVLESTDILEELGSQITDESDVGLVMENTYVWEEYSSVSANVFDMADGKSTIYYGTPSDTFTGVDVGDYLVDSTDGSTYKWDGVLWANVTNYTESIDSAIHALQDVLEEQIDGKIETWAQLTDPSADWTEDEKPTHNGDLWFYIGTADSTVKDSVNNYIHPSKTYQYNATLDKWALYDSPSRSLFDLADGKCTVFYGATTDTFTNPSPEPGDYLVDNTDADGAGCTYKRTSNNTWEKVTDYKAFTNSAIGIATALLEDQIDAKVETWAQATNPALTWDAESYKTHNGDLWLYTGMSEMTIDGVTIHPQSTYKFTYVTEVNILDESGNQITDESGNGLTTEISYQWVNYAVDSNVFDLADGKSTIYYGTPSSTFTGVEDGDYLVDSSDGTTYRRLGGQWNAVTKTGNLFGTCASVATAKEKVVTCNDSISVYDGLTISVRFENPNTSYDALMLNVGNLGVRYIYYNGAKISSTNRMYWTAGATISFMFDGTGWIVVGHPQTYNGSCSTADSTANKTSTIKDAVVVKGTVVNITFTNTNSASSAALSVITNADDTANTTNIPVIIVDADAHTLSSTSQYNWNAGATVGFVFDGQRWRLNDSSALYNTNSYMRFEAAYGLMIANMRNGVVGISSVTTPNTLLTSTDLQIRNGTTVLASFGSSVTLVSNGASITIGSTSSFNTYITSSSILFRYNGNQLASFGWDSTNSKVSLVLGNTSGYNTLVDNVGVKIRSGATVLASFGTSCQIGMTTTTHINILSNGMTIYASDGSTLIAHLGYALGTAESGTDTKPYFDFGLRKASTVIGNWSVAEGNNVIANGWCSHAEGGSYVYGQRYSPTTGTSPMDYYYTEASGAISHAEGCGTLAYGRASHAEGTLTCVSGNSSHAEGGATTASGDDSHAEGCYTIASGYCSHAQGYRVTAASNHQMAIGTYNVVDSSNTYAFIVGNGSTSTAVRSNALTLKWDGSLWIAKTLTQNSDRRLKTHISYLSDDAIDFINNLKPAHYRKDGTCHVGFYAQDVKLSDRWNCMVGRDDRGYLTLGYTEIIAPLVAYCQYLEKRITSLETEK